MDKLYAVKVTDCRTCILLGPVGAYCRADIENTDAIVLHEVLQNGGIWKGCPLPEYENLANVKRDKALLKLLSACRDDIADIKCDIGLMSKHKIADQLNDVCDKINRVILKGDAYDTT